MRGAAALLLALWLPASAWAQLADKPSAFAAKRRGETFTVPAGADKRLASLDHIASREAFDRIARVYAAGTEREITHALFVIDRAHGDRVHYVNANRYALHEEFVRGQYLAAGLDRASLAASYRRADRRFIFGTIGYRVELGRWTFEFWEGDQLTPGLLNTTATRLAATFFSPPEFKANSVQQEAVARAAGIAMVTEAQILGQRTYLPLNNGDAIGRLRLVDDLDSEAEDDIEPTDIIVLREVPLALPPVAGVITERPSTVLSHVNLLAKGWGIPNAYVADAFATLKPMDHRWVHLTVGATGYALTPATSGAAPTPRPRTATARIVRAADVRRVTPIPLHQLRHAHASACGGKAATLGEIEQGRRTRHIDGIAPVPDGFCIPFGAYAQFMARDDVKARVQAALASDGFERSRVVRRRALDALRRDLAALPLDDAVTAPWLAQWHAQLHGAGVFVRSSSNAEDLANFSGAGLFSTVPNVTRDEALAPAVLTVWASVFNFEAVEARRQAGIRDSDVVMAVFVQTAIDSVTSGVMVTRDPFDATHRNVVYVSAKRGIGIKVVEGRRVAEQSMFDPRSQAVRRLTRSEEDTALHLDSQGGVGEAVLESNHDVLSDEQVRALARAAMRIRQWLGAAEQDIEWATDSAGRIVILQSRPYLEHALL